MTIAQPTYPTSIGALVDFIGGYVDGGVAQSLAATQQESNRAQNVEASLQSALDQIGTGTGPSTGVAPVNTVRPQITGNVTVGAVLTCTPGSWDGSPTPTYAFQWYRGTTLLTGQTGTSYTVVSADLGALMTCVVTATNASGSVTATSNGLTAAGNAPVNTAPPQISGSITLNAILTLTTPGTWTGSPTYTYQWKRNGTNIANANGTTYQVVSADLTATITCAVTAQDPYGVTVQASNQLVAAPSGYTPLWSGTQLSDFSLIQVTQPADSFGPRAYNDTTTFPGQQVIGLMVRQTDMGPSSTNPSTNPRAQIVGPTNILQLGNTYRLTMSIYIPSANFPHPWTSGWLQLFQLYGQPYGGPAPISWGTNDGVNWGMKLGAQSYGGNAAYSYVVTRPMLYDQWVDITFDVKMATAGTMTITYNGTVIYNKTDYPNIISSDSTGPWAFYAQVYAQRTMTPSWTQFGPVYYKNMAILQNTGGAPVGNAPTVTASPQITGTVGQGLQLSVTSNGSWTGSPTSYSYQWYANNAAIPSATGSTYTIDAAYASDAIYVVVTAHNQFGPSAGASSNTLSPAGGGGGGTGAVTPTPTALSAVNTTLKFQQEFTGTSVDTTVWNTENGYTNKNGVTISASNSTVSNGLLNLLLASTSSGAEVSTINKVFNVGDIVEFRLWIPGSGSTVYNWPAAWSTDTATWPAAGEIDFFEGLGGGATVNYHSNSGASNGSNPALSGTWAGTWITVTAWRGSATNQTKVWWNQSLARTITTNDNGGAHQILLTNGYASAAPSTPATMQVDYVRIWSTTG